MHGQEPKAVDCPAIDGIIKEANEVAGEVADKQVLDAALIASAQAVEHYEITRYGTLIAWAKQLGRGDCACCAAAESRRGEGDRQEADRDGRKQGQPEGRLITLKGPVTNRLLVAAAGGPPWLPFCCVIKNEIKICGLRNVLGQFLEFCLSDQDELAFGYFCR